MRRTNRRAIRGFGQTRAFSPDQLPGIQWWLRADRNVSTSSVIQWNNSSGSADANRNFFQTSAAPTLVSSDPAFGNQPVISFDASLVQTMSMAGAFSDAPVNQPFTLFIVGKDDAVGVAGHQPWLGDFDTNLWYMATCPLSPDLVGAPHFISTIGTIPTTDVELQSSTIDTGQPVVWCFEYNNPNSSTMRINSLTAESTIQRGGSGSADTGISTLGRLTLGWSNGTGNSLNGKIAEVVIYDGILSPSSRSAVLNYLGARYGLIAGAVSSISSPKVISGLRLWLRADLGVTARVTSWSDGSGSGDANRNVANATIAKQPTLTTSNASFNGQPTVTFAGSHFLDMAGTWSNAPVVQPYTLIVVGNDSVAGIENFLGAKAANAWYVTSEGGVYKSDVVTTLSGTTPDSATPKILFFEYADPSSTIRVNANTAEATGTTNAPALPGLELGGNQQGQRPLTGNIAEVIAYRGALSSADRTRILSYLGARYGIMVGP